MKEITRGYEECLDTSTSSQESADSAWQQSNLGEYRQLSLLKSTPTLKQSCDRTSQRYPSTQTSETTTQNQENLTLLPAVSPALAQVTQEVEQDLIIQHRHSGEKVSDVLSKLNPASVLLNNLKEFSDEDLELFLPPYIWQDTVSRLKLSQQQDSEQVTEENGCLLFPTLTSNVSSTSRPAGQTKCERWFKSKGLVPNGSQLGTSAIALIMGFPSDWLTVLQKRSSKSPATQNPTEPQEESEPDISQDEQLPQDRQRSLSVESSISQKLLGDKLSIPCLVKQPHKKPFGGLIVGDRGDKFDVQVGDRIVQLPKLYVFPHLPEEKEKCRTDDDISPSKNSRRKKGTGSGSIYWRTVRKNGKEYQQTFYHYELWNKGRQVKSSVYIPKKMRSQIQKMNDDKAPVEDILEVLKSRSNKK